MIGESGCGKTSLSQKFAENKFNERVLNKPRLRGKICQDKRLNNKNASMGQSWLRKI